jgi:hypothetical protein
LFPRGELAVALDLADALLPVQVMQVGQSLFGAVDRRLDDMFTRHRVQRRLSKADAEEILSLAPEPDLIEQMPVGGVPRSGGLHEHPELAAGGGVWRISGAVRR